MTAETNIAQEKNVTADGEVFRLLFEDHPIPMAIYDFYTLAFLRVNQATVEKYGYSHEEFQTMSLGDILCEQDVLRLLEDLSLHNPALRNLGEWRNRCKDGSEIVAQVSAHALKFDNRKAVLVMAQDVTERKRDEETLRIAKSKFHSIFENATVGIYQSTPQGQFISVNPMMARIFGYDSPEQMLDSISNIATQYYVDASDRRVFEHLMNLNGKVSEFCSLNFRKDGSHIWIQENARAVKDAQGNVEYYEGFITDITGKKRAEDGLRRAKESLEFANCELERVLAREQQLARTDGLTGLYNYRYFFETASREFETAFRYQYPLSVLMFDADGFKQINDTHGHLVGDVMLSKMAETVAAQMRAADVLARYGGDEFVILLSHTNAQQAFFIAERIRLNVQNLKLNIENITLAVTLSIGVAEIAAQDENIERVVQRADKALYAAKQAGRNCTIIFNAE